MFSEPPLDLTDKITVSAITLSATLKSGGGNASARSRYSAASSTGLRGAAGLKRSGRASKPSADLHTRHAEQAMA